MIGITCGTRPRRYYDAYLEALAAAGAEPVLLAPGAAGPEAAELDGLLLPGGVDVDPALYGEAPHLRLGEVDPELDRREIRLLNAMLELGRPVLGICRGQQLVNVGLGGSLVQHLDGHNLSGGGRDHLAHEIRIEAGTRLERVAGGTTLLVNSLHHQAVDRVAPGLRVTATSPDGVIEGLESDLGWLVAVQCHPEELAHRDEWARRLLTAFAVEARAARAAAGR